MPSRHRYKCLNPDCPSMTDARKSMTFVAMNSPHPNCPHCRCMKLEDWGEAINIGVADSITHALNQGTDNNLQRIADRYGLSDMSNKDGQAVKRAAPTPAVDPKGDPAKLVTVGGYQVSADAAAVGGCVNMNNVTSPLSAKIGEATPNKTSPMMKQMTNVVAAHTGQTA